MTIVLFDGELKCSSVKIYDKVAVADDIYEIPLVDIFEIKEDDEE